MNYQQLNKRIKHIRLQTIAVILIAFFGTFGPFMYFRFTPAFERAGFFGYVLYFLGTVLAWVVGRMVGDRYSNAEYRKLDTEVPSAQEKRNAP